MLIGFPLVIECGDSELGGVGLVWFGFLFCFCFLGINVLCFVLSNKIQAVLLLLGA